MLKLDGELTIVTGPGALMTLRVENSSGGNEVVWVGSRSSFSAAIARPKSDNDMPRAERLRVHMDEAR
jgi:hypothetical protein